jgi:hypothetical protein
MIAIECLIFHILFLLSFRFAAAKVDEAHALIAEMQDVIAPTNAVKVFIVSNLFCQASRLLLLYCKTPSFLHSYP